MSGRPGLATAIENVERGDAHAFLDHQVDAVDDVGLVRAQLENFVLERRQARRITGGRSNPLIFFPDQIGVR